MLLTLTKWRPIDVRVCVCDGHAGVRVSVTANCEALIVDADFIQHLKNEAFSTNDALDARDSLQIHRDHRRY